MITAYASLDTVKNALTHGAFEYLIKPFSRTDLEETVRRALARRQTELGKRNQLSALVNEMRALATKTRTLRGRGAARAGATSRCASPSSRSCARSPAASSASSTSPAHRGHHRAAQGIARLRRGRGAPRRDAARGHAVRGDAPSSARSATTASIAGLPRGGQPPGTRPIDPRERELLEMLADSLAVAIRNSRLYGEVAETKRSLEQLVRSAGDAIISIDRRGHDHAAGTRPPSASSAGAPRKRWAARCAGMFPTEHEQAARQALTAATRSGSSTSAPSGPTGGC